VIRSWVGEGDSYKYHALVGTDVAWNHYTQVIWAATRRIGCGRAARTGDLVMYVCNYAPAGNVIGQFPYKAGKGKNDSCSVGDR
jgi:hypothetical protein